MDTSLFDELLEMHRDTKMRDSISAHNKLWVTLCFLASGQSYKQLRSASAISEFVPEVCKALYNVLKEDYMNLPTSRAQWLQVANKFEAKWQFPHAVGAIDGKHIAVQSPPNPGSEFLNIISQR